MAQPAATNWHLSAEMADVNINFLDDGGSDRRPILITATTQIMQHLSSLENCTGVKQEFLANAEYLAGSESTVVEQTIRTSKTMDQIFSAHRHLNAKRQWNIIHGKITDTYVSEHTLELTVCKRHLAGSIFQI